MNLYTDKFQALLAQLDGNDRNVLKDVLEEIKMGVMFGSDSPSQLQPVETYLRLMDAVRPLNPVSLSG